MLDIILIIVLVTFSAMFSSCETAFSTLNKVRVKNYAAQGNKKAALVIKLADSFDNALTAILIGNNIVNIASASISTVLFTNLLGSKGVGIATAVMTVVVLIFGEILPKSLAKENSEKFAFFFATPLNILIIILTPFIKFFTTLKKIATKLFGNGEKAPSVTEDELKYIINEIEEEGVLEESESELVRSALDFDETTVNEVLTPRVKVIGIDVNTPIEEIKKVFITEMYSRLPVYEKTLDNIIGIITQKDFFKMIYEEKEDIREIIQDVVFISEFKPINTALQQMQHSKTHMSIILDQYGGTKGIVTLEDIIEELVGEIYDEDDEIINTVVRLDEDTFEISGEATIEELSDALELPSGFILSDSNTLSGWIMEATGYIPKENEVIQINCFEIKILEKSNQKLIKVLLKRQKNKILSEDNE